MMRFLIRISPYSGIALQEQVLTAALTEQTCSLPLQEVENALIAFAGGARQADSEH